VNHEALVAELRVLREEVPGITDTLLADADGLLIVADAVDKVEPDALAALAAADIGLARRTSAVIGHGTLRRSVVSSSGGYLAVYAIGEESLLAVLGDEQLDLSLLHGKARTAVERLGAVLDAAQTAAR
jgi:predicted regulator of Ras-like GTPase activity (Roadblock/LC7/MglB family)